MHIKLVKSSLCPLLVCEHDKATIWKGSVLDTNVSMKGLGKGKKRLQHNIVDLHLEFQPQTDEVFTVDGRK